MTIIMRKKGHRPRLRCDPQYQWAPLSLARWREALSDFTAQYPGRDTALGFGSQILDYLLANPGVAQDPEVFCRRTYQNPLPFLLWIGRKRDAWKTRLQNCAHAFFEWFIVNRVGAPDDSGQLLASPEHCNPVPRTRVRHHASETARTALPIRFLRQLLEVLTGDDWAWARSQTIDHVQVTNPETGELQTLWCPVRASALALKLLLPLRTFQVRMLESSEGDDVRFSKGQWVPNRGPGAPPPGTLRRRGFLHRFEGSPGDAPGVGFFVNTNKTGDRFSSHTDVGYVIPWEHKEAIAVVEQLEAWQARYNPVSAPTRWADLHDIMLARSVAREGSAFFLMRDPSGSHPNEPVTDGCVRELWRRLVIELEGRLAARGETAANGQPIVLTRPDPRRAQGLAARYDLHTLRVSLITALAIDGGLPLSILSKAVAGHASVIMTLYYVKVSPQAMKEQIDAAMARIDTVEQERFAQFLSSEARDDAACVSNNSAGMAAVMEGDVAAWTMLDTGICPVGATRCHDGGPMIQKGVHGPVPGGARNCVRCRFHVTGGPFLGGLVARFNTVSMTRDTAEREARAAMAALRAAEDFRVEVENHGDRFDVRPLVRARERLDRAEARTAAAKATMQEIAFLVYRTREVMAKKPFGLNLVPVGRERDLRIAIETTTDIDLADRVCQVAEIYPSTEAFEAALRRSVAIDRAAQRHGHPPVMLRLSEAEALQTGNEMMQLLTEQFGRDRAIRVLDGTEHLVDEAAALLGDCLAKVSAPALPAHAASAPIAIEHRP